jgi:hypothetical protein
MEVERPSDPATAVVVLCSYDLWATPSTPPAAWSPMASGCIQVTTRTYRRLRDSYRFQQRLLERSAPAPGPGSAPPTGGRRGHPLQQLGRSGGEVAHLDILRCPRCPVPRHRPLRPRCRALHHLASGPKLQRADRQAHWPPGRLALGTSASLDRPTHLQSRRPTAVDRQVRQRLGPANCPMPLAGSSRGDDQPARNDETSIRFGSDGSADGWM